MSRGRANKQITVEHLPSEICQDVHIICNHDEGEEYEKHNKLALHIVPAPPEIDNYSKKMQWCIDEIRDKCDGKGIIMDDDLWFDIRRTDAEKLRKPEHKDELLEMFRMIELLLEDTALVGIHPRQFGHAKPLPYVENGKMVCVHAINTSLLPDNFPRVDGFPILSDVRLVAGLLARGIPNKLITQYVVDWAPCMADGGCSDYRTHEMQREGCEQLAEMFGPYLKVKIKETKNDGFGGERYDFTCRWRDLYRNAPLRDL
jgi:hypothetical protein